MSEILWYCLGTACVFLMFGFMIGKANADHWLVESQRKEIDNLKAKLFDTQPLQKDNEELSEFIKALVLEHGKVKGDWKGYNYEHVSLEVHGLTYLPSSRYEKFNVSGKCYRLKPDDKVCLAYPMSVEVIACRQKKPEPQVGA